MRILAVILIAGLLTACAADPAKVQAVAESEAERLAPPSRPLSSYAEFELRPMTFSQEIMSQEGKRQEAREFEGNLVAKVSPLLDQWNAADNIGTDGKLGIKVHVDGLRIVSGGNRFWAGAWAGNSFIDIDLQLIDENAGAAIAKVRIRRDADAMTGSWSVGKSDQNLDDYIVSIVHEYLADNY